VHDVVDAHHGTITVDNIPGANFTITFPLDTPSAT
jgi:signal transduction histidine kinase